MAALSGPQDCVAEMRTLYRDRRDVLIRGLHAAGWDVPSPEGSMFAWAPLPAAFREMGSVDFSKLLLKEAGVAVAPGLGFGEYGEGFVRIGLVENTQRLRQATRAIRQFMGRHGVNLPDLAASGRRVGKEADQAADATPVI